MKPHFQIQSTYAFERKYECPQYYIDYLLDIINHNDLGHVRASQHKSIKKGKLLLCIISIFWKEAAVVKFFSSRGVRRLWQRVEEISGTDIDEWHETPDVNPPLAAALSSSSLAPQVLETCVSSYHKNDLGWAKINVCSFLLEFWAIIGYFWKYAANYNCEKMVIFSFWKIKKIN